MTSAHRPAALELHDLHKSYGSVRAVAFLGPNGAGKTTTIDMVLGLARPDAGTPRSRSSRS
jgi:ABC-2 type transport system ATP-binding protein